MSNYNIFWTFQRKDVVEKILTDGEYIPNFQTLFGTDKEYILPAYYHILNDYNNKNYSIHRGLIFGHVGGHEISRIETIDQLYSLIEQAGWPEGTYYPSSTHELLKVHVPIDIDIMSVDFYRFYDLIFTYDKNESDKIKESVTEALYLPNGPDNTWELVQGHIPFIKKEWVDSISKPYDR